MKRLIIGSLSVLLVATATTPAVKAEPIAVNLPTIQNSPTSKVELTPNQLVSLAYSGYLKSQGVPSYGALSAAVNQGSINAQDLVQSAIKAHRLPAQVLANQGYLGNVQNQLQNTLRIDR